MRSQRSRHLTRRESDFREFGALQNFAMHFAVAASISAIAARRIDNDCPACFTRRGIEPDRAALEFENSVDGMQNVPKGEGDFGLCSVKLDDGFLCPDRGGSEVRGEQGNKGKKNSQTGKPGPRHITGLEPYARKNFHPKSTISDAPMDESESSPVWMAKSLENRAGLF
jgi:hypothetical protein